MAADRLPDPAAICPGCKRPVSECQAEDVADPLFLARDAVSPADTRFPRATPRPWEALDVEGGKGVYPWVGWTDPEGQIVTVVETEDCDEIDRDNVRLIVQAVNERDALLAAAERDKAEREAFRKALADEGLPEDASVDDLIRHHRGNAALVADAKAWEAGERDRQRIRDLTEEVADLKKRLGYPKFARGVHAGGEDAERSSSAWLIERGQPERQDPPIWWIAGPRLDSRNGEKWTKVAFDATRFTTAAEAQAVVDGLFTGPAGYSPPGDSRVTARAVEHGFITRAAGEEDTP